MRSNDVPLDLFFAAAAVLIPTDHPAYTDRPKAVPGRAARRWSMLVASIAGLVSVAAISSGVAHYILETAAPAVAHYILEAAAPASVAASASPAMTAAIPAAQPITPAAEPAAASPVLPLTAVPAAEASSAPPVDAAPSIAAKHFARLGVRPMKLASLARKKAARGEIERPAVAAFDAAPAADAMLVAAVPLNDAVTSMPATDNTNRK